MLENNLGKIMMDDVKLNDIKLKIKNLKVYFKDQNDFKNLFKISNEKNEIRAIDDVSLDVYNNEVLGIVGESGCGKSTLANAVLLMVPITDGEIYLDKSDISRLRGKKIKEYYSNVQLIWQNPFSSLNPRMNISELILRPLLKFKKISRKEAKNKIKEIIKCVGLNIDDLSKYPHEFSGGGRQRIAIARALVTGANFIIADEPTSSLDVSIQAQILNLLKDLNKDLSLTMIFISHNLSVINFISNRVAVMYFGKIVEILPKEELFINNYHYYTKKLIDAIPKGNKIERYDSIYEKIHKLNYNGCIYYYRCEKAKEDCAIKIPELKEISKNHFVSCHYPIL